MGIAVKGLWVFFDPSCVKNAQDIEPCLSGWLLFVIKNKYICGLFFCHLMRFEKSSGCFF